MTKQQHYNRIKEIIENKENTIIHLPSIGNIIRNFTNIYGVCKLSVKLEKTKLEFIKSL